MLGRSTTIVHKASGETIRTPLLVPSFSSKGLASGRAPTNDDSLSSDSTPKAAPTSDIENILRFASEFLTHTCLISAYDLHYDLIPAPAELPNVEIIFLDSGGYEVSLDQDLSTVVAAPPGGKPWDAAMYQETIAEWPSDKPTVLISFDHPARRTTLETQIKEARQLFGSAAPHLSLLLLKPEDTNEYTVGSVIGKVVAKPNLVAAFDIIGVTEKELGGSIMDRMIQIARLRTSLDHAGIKAPIHVFGALDPMSVCFYFLAGAEIFDGLTWMRYAYDAGRCVYFSNFGATTYDLHLRDQQVRSRSMTANIYALESLEHRMREFLYTHDYTRFEPYGPIIEKAVESLMTHLEGG